MYGDWSRIRFDPASHYLAVVKQQGRVDLDSDDLEQHAIDLALRRTINTDVIGLYGAPEGDAGFAIALTAGGSGFTITIGKGRYYLNGLLVDNPSDLDYDQQPYLIDPADNAAALFAQLARAAAGATIGFVLQAWVRTATALDDPNLLEPALGGADTTVRLQTVWRVIGTVIPAPTQTSTSGAQNDPVSLLAPSCQALYNPPAAVSRTGLLTASLAQSGSDCGCQPIAAAGYQGLENQLYRVEIHQGGDLTSATFKWSRENGSVVTAITSASKGSAILTVTSLGKDANLGFAAGQWVEISDDTFLYGPTPNKPGVLCQIQGVNPATLQVTLSAPLPVNIDPNLNARMRRWDQSGAAASASGAPVSSNPTPLENGVLVAFSAGSYSAGDYWTIPARTASGGLLWPPNGSTEQAQPASFTRIFSAPIASVTVLPGDPNRRGSPGYHLNDCRLLFPPLNALAPFVTPPALHVSAISWVNDDVMTVDSLLQHGLSVTFDAAPANAWGGGNFEVTLEPPLLSDVSGSYETIVTAFSAIGETNLGTDVFLRTVFDLDPPQGVTVSSDQAVWLSPVTDANSRTATTLWLVLNTALGWQNPLGFARVRVRLDGGAVFATGAAGNLYLDGQTFGVGATRASDGGPRVDLPLPSGHGAKVSDFESWFYLAPSLRINSLVISGTVQGAPQQLTAITLQINPQGVVQHIYVGATAQGSTVTNIQAVMTFSYPPLADTPVSLSLSGTAQGASTIASIAKSTTAKKAATTATAPISFQGNPTTATTYQLALEASVATAVSSLALSASLAVTVVVVTPPPVLQ